MENENNDKTVLTDEELKAVAGGIGYFSGIPEHCKKLNIKKCYDSSPVCKWEDGKCVQNTKIS